MTNSVLTHHSRLSLIAVTTIMLGTVAGSSQADQFPPVPVKPVAAPARADAPAPANLIPSASANAARSGLPGGIPGGTARSGQPAGFPGGQLLALGSGEGTAAGSVAVRTLQLRLSSLGYSPGLVDGRYGPRTQAAVLRFQSDNGLSGDGVAGPQTLRALDQPSRTLYPGAGFGGAGSSAVRALQVRLTHAGAQPGPVDGMYGFSTAQAVRRFQAAHGLAVNGIAGPQTLAALDAPAVFGLAGSSAKPAAPTPARPFAVPQLRSPASPVSRRSGQPRPLAAPNPQLAHHPTGTTGTGSLTLALLVLAPLLVLAALALGIRLLRGRSPEHGIVGPETAGTGGRPAESQAATPDASIDLAPAELGAAGSEKTNGFGGHAPESHDEQVPNAQASEPVCVGAEDPSRPVGAEANGASSPADAGNGPWSIEGPHPGAPVDVHPATVDRPAEPVGAERTGDPASTSDLGVLLERQGDFAAAEAAYREADERGDANGAFNLGGVLAERGELAEAEAAYRRADERGDAGAAANLGMLLEQHGDLAGAEAAYRRADDRGHPEAASNLGVLLEERGDFAEAEAAYRRADQRGDASGAFNLGGLLAERGDLAGAAAAYSRADERGDPAAASNLGVLLERQGDPAAAADAYRRGDQRGHAAAAFNLGVLLAKCGDLAGAESAYRRAHDRGDADVAQMARAALLEVRGVG